MNVILLGPPGAGKGKQAGWLRTELGMRHLASGDLLRRHRADGTDLGREAAAYMSAGKLVPDELVVAVVLAEIAADLRDDSCSTASLALWLKQTASRRRFVRTTSS